jgi:hypothetical protein
VLGRYLADSLSLSPADWRLLREAIDLLAQSTIVVADEMLTFTQFYDRFVDQPYADRIITQLDAATDPMRVVPSLQAETARHIVADFAALSQVNATDAERKLLLAFCLYWWAAFARGYAFEIAIFRDLAQSGIAFIPHDYRHREERRSFCDFFVGGFAADVKLSTYFLAKTRARAFTCDIYITRLFDTQQRIWGNIVVLSERAWQAIDGETTPAALEQVAALLPEAACLLMDAPRWVVISYDHWKTMILAKQQMSGGTTP